MKLLKQVTGSFLVLIIFFSFTTGTIVHGRIFGNGSGCVYCEPATESAIESVDDCSNSLINLYIEESAARFLNSFSSFLTVLSKLELLNQQGASQEEMLVLLKSSKTELQTAISLYTQIIEIAESTPYNQAVILDLHVFDYKSFGKVNSLDDPVYKKVQGFLEAGDVTGAYKWIREKLIELAASIDSLSHDLEMGVLPPNSGFWNLNKDFNRSMLFGQYMAEVFYSIVCLD
jgi:hypothetical protein